MMPWTESGSGESCALPRSASIRTYCSAYSGLPPARSSSADCVSASSSGRSLSAEITRRHPAASASAVGAELVDRLGERGQATILAGSVLQPLKLEFAGKFDIRLGVAIARKPEEGGVHSTAIGTTIQA